MIPFIETINSKEELIEACKKGFEDYSNKRISKNDFCMYFGFTHGQAITTFYEGNYEQLLVDGGFNTGSSAYFAGGINAWKNLRDGKYVFPPFVQNVSRPSIINGQTLQQIFYGAPGTGKSHEVKKLTGELLENEEEVDLPNVFRTTFHPDTDYASFVGCYKPTMKPTTDAAKTLSGKEEEIVYEFVPQVFTNAYVYAYTTQEPTYLVIEEINRGNCAQIFGDLFQLLDRKNGKSEYKIKADNDLAKYLREQLGADSEGIQDGKLCLPANLHILATMNTSDQSLFPMDSAFKRRWDWEYVPINYGTGVQSGSFVITIGDKSYSWVDFIKQVNEKIFDLTQSEDKQMGNFFIKHSINEDGFKSKVMFYLWYEVLRDETENNKYFFYKKTTVDSREVSSKFTFKDLYGDQATETLQQFMEYLKVSPK
ncbi:MAG: AAA family ATPase [Paludibacteraceae bacterium]|nr:AAA family ATPase [Paludibacteraceae bacterium]